MCRSIKTLFNFDPPATDEAAQLAHELERGGANPAVDAPG
jgi:hypothetical protein